VLVVGVGVVLVVWVSMVSVVIVFVIVACSPDVEAADGEE
jgi:hypothetical protein